MTDVTALIVAMLRAQVSQKEVAAFLGLSESGLYKKMNGGSEFWVREIRKLQELLNLTNAERDHIFFA
jgi:transcriptional regulator with XRE-family HTH domain